MKLDLDAVHADRCRQLARHVAAAMTLSRVSAFEAVEMALLAAGEWFGEMPERQEPGGKLLAAILAAASAAAEARHGHKSKAEIAALLAAAIALASPLSDNAGAAKTRPRRSSLGRSPGRAGVATAPARPAPPARRG